MGWYVTCDICGKEGKYRTMCNCYNEESDRNILRTIGCVVEMSFIYKELYYESLIQKFRTAEGSVFYLLTRLSDAGGEYSWLRKIIEITEDEFLSYKNNDNSENIPSNQIDVSVE